MLYVCVRGVLDVVFSVVLWRVELYVIVFGKCVSVSSCRCCIFVSSVHPVAIPNDAFCITHSFDCGFGLNLVFDFYNSFIFKSVSIIFWSVVFSHTFHFFLVLCIIHRWQHMAQLLCFSLYSSNVYVVLSGLFLDISLMYFFLSIWIKLSLYTRGGRTFCMEGHIGKKCCSRRPQTLITNFEKLSSV